MKKLITSYNFNAGNKTVILNEYTSVNQDGLLLITNVTDNVIIYNFASSTLGATVSGNTITLAYNTTSMSNSDSLMIFYDDGAVDDDAKNLGYLLKEILEELKGIKLVLELK